MKEKSRQDAQPGFVLHSYPFRETSLIIEAFTRDHGRIGLVARGARRPKSSLRGILLPFQPLLLSWAGKGELHTLMRAEWLGGYVPLRGQALICGFYLNELVMKLLARGDAHEQLFSIYENTLAALAAGEDQPALAIRLYARAALLREVVGGFLHYELGWPDPAATLDALRSRVGEAMFEEEWERGRALTLLEAIDQAIGEQRKPEPSTP